MFAETRRKQICKILVEHSAVTTADMAEKFNVSIETIRKDFLDLEKSGELMRVHGGAVLKPSVNPFLNFSSRMESMRSEKVELAEISTRFINNGDTLALDSGSTGIEFIDVLMKHFDTLTIVTTSLDIFQKACEFKNFNIILTGGFYLKGENTLYGEFALKTLDNIRVEKSFIFPSSISLGCGIMGSLSGFVDIQRKMIEISDEVYIAADSSKFEKTSLIKTADLNPRYTYITDSGISAEIKQIYESNGIHLITE